MIFKRERGSRTNQHPKPSRVKSLTPLFTPAARGQVTHQVVNLGKWHGTRKGIAMQFELSKQPSLTGNRIAWRARSNKIWQRGKAGTVWEAIEQIERMITTNAAR